MVELPTVFSQKVRTTTTVATLAMKRPEAQSTMSQLVAGDLPIISDVVREAL